MLIPGRRLAAHLTLRRLLAKPLVALALVCLLLLVGLATELPGKAVVHAAGPSPHQPQPHYGTTCLEFYGNQLNSYGAQGASGDFFVENTCPQPISGNIYMDAEVTDCIYSGGYYGAAGTGPQSYELAGYESGVKVTWSMVGMCIECDCAPPPPWSGFTMYVTVYADDEPSNFLLLGTSFSGGPYNVSGSCGADARGDMQYS
jgi:hypothetical protein